MIIWGSTGKEVELQPGTFVCPGCGSEQEYRYVQIVRYFTLYFIPLFPTRTVGGYVICQRCGGQFQETVLDGQTIGPRPRPVKTTSSLAVAAAVVAGIGLALSLIPCCFLAGIPLSMVGLVLGIIAFFVSRSAQAGRGLPIAAMAMASGGLIIGTAWFVILPYIKTDEVAREKGDNAPIVITADQLSQEFDAQFGERET